MDKLNSLHPSMVERGGGVRDIEVRVFEQTDTVLVRPDKLVFGHTTETLGPDQLVERLSSMLALTNPAKAA